MSVFSQTPHAQRNSFNVYHSCQAGIPETTAEIQEGLRHKFVVVSGDASGKKGRTGGAYGPVRIETTIIKCGMDKVAVPREESLSVVAGWGPNRNFMSRFWCWPGPSPIDTVTIEQEYDPAEDIVNFLALGWSWPRPKLFQGRFSLEKGWDPHRKLLSWLELHRDRLHTTWSSWRWRRWNRLWKLWYMHHSHLRLQWTLLGELFSRSTNRPKNDFGSFKM